MGASGASSQAGRPVANSSSASAVEQWTGASGAPGGSSSPAGATTGSALEASDAMDRAVGFAAGCSTPPRRSNAWAYTSPRRAGCTARTSARSVRAACASSEQKPCAGIREPMAIPWAVASATRTPVNDPGPRVTTIACSSSGRSPAPRRRRSTAAITRSERGVGPLSATSPAAAPGPRRSATSSRGPHPQIASAACTQSVSCAAARPSRRAVERYNSRRP